MKPIYVLPKKANCLLLLTFFICVNVQTGFGQLFQQDFNTGNPISQYVSPFANNSKFTALSTSISGASITAASNALVFSRTTGSASFSRILNFAPVPVTMKYSFDLSVVCSGSTTNVAQFKVGQGFSNANTPELNTATYGRFGVDFVGGNQFKIRDMLAANSNSNTGNPGPYSSPQHISWFLNNSGATISYVAPNATVETLGNDMMDIWVGTTKVFNDIGAQMPSGVSMSNLKFILNAGSGSVGVDNMLIDPAICNLSVNVSTTNVDCPSDLTGTATANIVSGTPNYTYLWSPGGQTTSSISGLGIGSYNVTVTDGSGCTAAAGGSVVQNADRIFPTITCSANIVDYPTDPGFCSAFLSITPPTVSDNCGIASLTNDYDSLSTLDDIFAEGITTVIWTVVDNSGNVSTCSQTIEVVDHTDPTFDQCPTDMVVNTSADGTGDCLANVSWTIPNPLDDCIISDFEISTTQTQSAVVYPYFFNSGDELSPGFYTVTYTATDASGNTATCSFNITVVDDEAPTILLCPPAVTVACSADVPTPDPGLVEGEDNCGGSVTITFAGDVTSNQLCVNQYTITRAYRLVDDQGNADTCFQTIIVKDSIPPVVTFGPAYTDTYLLNCTNEIPAITLPSEFPDAQIYGTDNCNGTVSFAHVSDVVSDSTCPNRFIITRTYRAYDECGNTTYFVQTITINDQTAPQLTGTLPGGGGYQCMSSAPSASSTADIAAAYTDHCGSVIVTFAGSSSTGNDCDGWSVSYTYHITDSCGNAAPDAVVTYSGIHTDPPVISASNGSSTAQCATGLAVPSAPTGVVDACGNPVSPTGPAVSGTYAGCEGTIIYTYTYTDCADLVSTWTYTYTIDHTTAPVLPANGSSTVECSSSATDPGAPTGIVDVCGNPVAAGPAQKRLSFLNDFSSFADTGIVSAPGIWYTDRYNPHSFTAPYIFGGNAVLKESIDTIDDINHRPVAFNSTFYNTQGRKFNLGTSTDEMQIKLWVPAAWASENKREAGFWGTAVDGLNNVSAFPIVEFSSDGNNPRFRVWESGTGVWVDLGLPVGFTYDSWVTLKIKLLPSGEFRLSAGSLSYNTVTSSADGSVRLDNVILQGYNYTDAVNVNVGVVYNIFWDDFTWNDVYSDVCQGMISYSYDYTDCSGLTSEWMYTYTVHHVTAPVVPGPGSSTVECVTAATDPGAATGVVDVCGNPVTITGPAIGGTYTSCEGTKTYTYTYTDCAGLATDWTYTYTIDHVTPPAVPADGASTVECLSAATPPTPPGSGSATQNFTGSLTGSDPSLTYRLFRDGVASTCGTPKTCPGPFSVAGNYHYRTFSYTNPFAIAACVTASYSSSGGDIFVTAYNGSFDPLNICQNYLADGGLSTGGTNTVSFGYIAPGATVVIVATNSNDGQLTPSFTISLSTVASPIVDVCGTPVPAVLVSTTDAPDPLTCEGTRTYSYSYTDCSGLSSTWNYVYTIDHTTAPVVPAGGSSTVECASAATAPTPPSVVDVCGASITPSGPVTSGTYVDCEGTIIYTYTYTDCSGLSTDWSYTYTVDHTTAPVVPAGGASTVECASAALIPTPPSVTDVCGSPIIPSGPVTSGSYVDCEGTIIYTYTYTDCSGLSTDWSYTYTIDHTTAPVVPANGSSTVECSSSATDPGAPSGIVDVCGNPVAAGPVQKRLSFTDDFSTAVTTSSVAGPGVWYTDRHDPSVFSSPYSFGGGSVLIESIDGGDFQGTPFYNTQGRGHDLGTATDEMEIKLYIPSSWATANQRLAGFWGVAYDNTNALSEYPIIEFTSDGNNPRFRVWEDAIGWTDIGLPVGFTYDNWITLKIKVLSNGEFLFTAGSLTYTTSASSPAGSVRLGSVILQGYNTGNSYDIYWDDFTYNDTYSDICQGTITYSYDYFDCSGLASEWTYTYNVHHVTAPVVPAPGSSTVECATSALPPGAPTGVVDVCGNPTTVTGPTIGGSYLATSCEGDITFTYTFTDCAGLATDWTYTYNIDHITPPVVPLTGSGTVLCSTAAIDPGAPTGVVDVCGNPITNISGPVVSGTYVDCEGTIIYTYTFTDCSGLSSDWSFIYTVDHTIAPVVPGDGSSTVQCLSSANDPGPPTGVVDVCGNPVTVTGPVIVDLPGVIVASAKYNGGTNTSNTVSPFCEGTRTYTYTFTDCSGLSTDWNYVYTINHTDPPVVPGNGSSTVECASSAVDPGPPTGIVDVCGAPIIPTGPVQSGTYIDCEGTIIYTYSFTDCAGLNTDWSYTYTIHHVTSPSEFGGPVSNSSTVSCAGDALALDPADLPVIHDVCGNVLSPSSPLQGGTYNGCSGTISWTYTYTDCAGLSTDWTYTYNVIYSGGLTPPAPGSSTVSCPFESQVNPGADFIYDACGRIIIPQYVSNDPEPNCNGDVVWTFLYLSCDGNTGAYWTYTYHVLYSGGLSAPAPGGSFVSCPAEALVAPLTTDIIDACGRTVHAVYLSNDPVPNCNGDVVWTYSYTACDNTTITNWTYTYHVQYNGGLTAPTPGSSTVSCPSEALVAPGAPDITDACGRTVHGSLVSNDPAPTCNGDVVWTYIYIACDNVTVTFWEYTYHVVYSGGLTAPTPGSSTVSCPADAAVNPGAPDITDACGRTVHGLYVSNDLPPTCNGDVVWTFVYIGCDGITSTNWTYTYHIVYSGGLTAPTPGSSTVSCPIEASVYPGAPDILDACGRTVHPQYVSNDPLPNCNGDVVWTFVYYACDNVTSTHYTYTYHVIYSGGLTAPTPGSTTVSCPSESQVNPGAPDIADACGRQVHAVLVGHDNAPNCNGDVVWTFSYTACDNITTTNWTYTYHVLYSGGLSAPTAGSSTVSCPSEALVAPSAPDITDACGRTVHGVYVSNDPAPTCNGDVVWTYSYTACDGITTTNWTYTYHVVYSGGLTAPSNGGSTIQCASAATDPGAPADIQDACGRLVHATLVGSTTPPTCNGSVVWTYVYTACDGITTANWTYTYTITHTTSPSIPSDGLSTVQCASDANDPGAPFGVTDVCGNPISGVYVSTVNSPDPIVTSGTRTYTYSFTDCAGLVSYWHFVYTIADNTPPSISGCPGSFTAPISCAGVVNYTAPTAIDNCSSVTTVVTPAYAVSGGTFPVGVTHVKYVFTDASGNSDSCRFDVTINALSVSTSSTLHSGYNISCNGGNDGIVNTLVTNNQGSPTYLWSNSATTSSITNGTATTYTVTVTDGSCTATSSITLTQPSHINLTVTPTNATCNGSSTGQATANVSGGVGPYSYLWSNGQITQTITGLSIGTYTVTVHDANGCTVPSVFANITQPTVMNYSTSKTSVSCFGGNNASANAVGSGGTPPYTYSWNTVPVKTTQAITGLVAGSYTVTITDHNGCSVQATVTITQPPQLFANISVPGSGGPGTATASGSGGTPGYSFLWSNGAISQTISTTPHTTYTVTVTDGKGCHATASTSIAKFGQVETGDPVSVSFGTKVYPNPTHGNVTIEFSALENQQFNLQLIDYTGRIILNNRGTSADGINTVNYDFSDLAKGIYFIRLDIEDRSELMRVVFE